MKLTIIIIVLLLIIALIMRKKLKRTGDLDIDTDANSKPDLGIRDIKDEYFEKIQIPQYLNGVYPELKRYELLHYGSGSIRQKMFLPFKLYFETSETEEVKIPSAAIAGWNKQNREPAKIKPEEEWLMENKEKIINTLAENEKIEIEINSEVIDIDKMMKMIEDKYGVKASYKSNKILIEP